MRYPHHIRLTTPGESTGGDNEFGDPDADPEPNVHYDGRCRRVWRSHGEKRMESGDADVSAETKEFFPREVDVPSDADASVTGTGGETMTGDVIDINPTENSIVIRWQRP